LCEPHPDLQTRLKYDQVDALAEDIKVHGQLQPGRAVERPDGTGYFVYMGIGRLLAVKELFEKDGEPRSYYALLDEGLPFVELFSRSMSENLKRRNLSVLEEIRSFYLASRKADEDEIVAASSRIGEEPSMVRKRIELARVLGDKLSRMYDMEVKAHNGFAFQIGHLEALAKITQEREFYEASATSANLRFSVKELQSSLRNNSIDKITAGLPGWFYEVFPEYAKKSQIERDTTITVVGDRSGAVQDSARETKPEEKKHVDSSPSTQEGETAGASADSRADVSTTSAQGSRPPAGVPYREDQAFVACPYCGAQAPFDLKEDSEITLVRFKGTAVPEKDSVAPEGSYRRRCVCVNAECGEVFWLWSAIIDGELKAEAKAKDDEGWFSLPKGEPRIGSVSWSAERNSWIVKEKGSGKEYLYGEDRKFLGT
jgi:hypothetical protein